MPGAAFRPAGGQAAGQLSAQLTASLDEQGLVKGFVAHLHHGIACELDPQPGRDLLRRPPRLQPLGDLGSQPGTRQLGRLRAAGLLASVLMGLPRRHPRRPPSPATSLDTVDVALPSRAAITVSASPACRPRLISCRRCLQRQGAMGQAFVAVTGETTIRPVERLSILNGWWFHLEALAFTRGFGEPVSRQPGGRRPRRSGHLRRFRCLRVDPQSRTTEPSMQHGCYASLQAPTGARVRSVYQPV